MDSKDVTNDLTGFEEAQKKGTESMQMDPWEW